MKNSDIILKVYQQKCDQLYIQFKNQAEQETALGKAKQRVRKKDIETFAALIEIFGQRADKLADEYLKDHHDLGQELSNVNKDFTLKMSILGRKLTDRLR